MGRIYDASHLVKLLTEGLITSLDKFSQLVGGDANTEYFYMHKAGRRLSADVGASVSASWFSLWEQEGTPVGHGAAPGAFAIPDNTTQGGIGQTDPGGGRTKFLSSMVLQGGVGGCFVLCDRLLHMSGMDGTVTTAQNVNGGASADVTRYTDGVGNILVAEIYTQIGATARTITAAYKDGAGAAKTTQPVVWGGTNRSLPQTVSPMSLAAAGSTVKGVTSATISATTGTAGNFGVSILHPLVVVPAPAGGGFAAIADYLAGAPMPPILTDACLAWYWIASDVNFPCFDAFATFVETT